MKLPDLDEKTHVYTLNSTVKTGVTQAIDFLYDFGGASKQRLRFAAERGKAVHLACHLLDERRLDWRTVDPRTKGYVKAWRNCCESSTFVSFESELRVYNPRHDFAGTLDRIGAFRDEDRCVLDIKTSATPSDVAGLQTAAYLLAYNYRRAKKAERRYACYLRADGTYRLAEHTDPADFPTFLAILQIKQWKQKYATK